jgi:hypothetical protein
MYNCVISTCSASDQLLTHQYDVYICGLYGISTFATPTVVSTAIAATATANAPVTESITSAVAATDTNGLTTPPIAAGQTSPVNTNNPTSSGIVPQNSGPNIGAIVGGVVGGVVALAILIGILFYVYNRGHRQGRNFAAVIERHNDTEHQETLDLGKEAVAPPMVVQLKNRTGELSGGRVKYPEDVVEPPVSLEVPSGRLNYPDLDLIGGRMEE